LPSRKCNAVGNTRDHDGRKSGSLKTHRWRKVDSNRRSHLRPNARAVLRRRRRSSLCRYLAAPRSGRVEPVISDALLPAAHPPGRICSESQAALGATRILMQAGWKRWACRGVSLLDSRSGGKWRPLHQPIDMAPKLFEAAKRGLGSFKVVWAYRRVRQHVDMTRMHRHQAVPQLLPFFG
jgi:hypothetical protein